MPAFQKPKNNVILAYSFTSVFQILFYFPLCTLNEWALVLLPSLLHPPSRCLVGLCFCFLWFYLIFFFSSPLFRIYIHILMVCDNVREMTLWWTCQLFYGFVVVIQFSFSQFLFCSLFFVIYFMIIIFLPFFLVLYLAFIMCECVCRAMEWGRAYYVDRKQQKYWRWDENKIRITNNAKREKKERNKGISIMINDQSWFLVRVWAVCECETFIFFYISRFFILFCYSPVDSIFLIRVHSTHTPALTHSYCVIQNM